VPTNGLPLVSSTSTRTRFPDESFAGAMVYVLPLSGWASEFSSIALSASPFVMMWPTAYC
jgi:hypothetical protein